MGMQKSWFSCGLSGKAVSMDFWMWWRKLKRESTKEVTTEANLVPYDSA